MEAKQEEIESLIELEDRVEDFDLDDPKVDPLSPYESANFLSKFVYHYIQGFLSIGNKRPIKFDDLPPLSREDRADVVHERLLTAWTQTSKINDSHWRLAQAIWWTFRWDLAFAASFSLVGITFLFFQPVITSRLITFLVNDSGKFDWPTLSRGLTLLGLSAFVKIVQVLCDGYHMFLSERLILKVASALSVLVYRKSLRCASVSTGNASNLLVVDPRTVGSLAAPIHSFWRMPTRVGTSCVMLYLWLGWPMFLGLGLVFVLAPINWFLMRKMSKAGKSIMAHKDNRVKYITEVLNGMSIIKLFGWETQMAERIFNLRALEVTELKHFSYWRAAVYFFAYLCISLVVTIVLGAYFWVQKFVDAALIFPALSLIGFISSLVEAVVSLKRMNTFLRRDELEPLRGLDKPKALESEEFPIQITGAEFHYRLPDAVISNDGVSPVVAEPAPEKPTNLRMSQVVLNESNASLSSSQSVPPEQFILRIPELSIKRGELVGIIGRVGSGKSSLLSALLGELQSQRGGIVVEGSIAYVSQQAWIRNATFRDNILFGAPYHQERYDKVLRDCCLVEDLKLFSSGDLTEIGEKGVNLSGGQKQRVALARAAYADSDVYFLDDPLSAVDARVGKSLFDGLIRGSLDGKTRLLVTHQLQYLPRVDKILVMEKGRIQQQGTYNEILAKGLDFGILLQDIKEHHEEEKKPSTDPVIDGSDSKDKEKESAAKIIVAEEHITGAVSVSVYRRYFVSCGGWLTVGIVFFAFMVIESLSSGQRLWLSVWSDGRIKPDPGLLFYIGIYIGFAIVQNIFSAIRNFLWAKVSLDAAQTLHNNLLESILKAPMSFFNANPIGRIINRFSKDQGSLDQTLPLLIADFTIYALNCLVIIVIISYSIPYFILVVIPIIAVYYFIQNFFRNSSRELSRLKSISSSPIFAQYSETLHGLSIIRAYGAQERLSEENISAINDNIKASFQATVASRWLGIRVDFLGILIGFGVAFVALLKGHVTGGAIGIALTLSTSITQDLTWLVRVGADLESNMSNTERILYMTDVKPEGPRVIESSRPPRAWPTQGAIEFRNVWLRYHDDLPPILKGISFAVKAMEKVGVVGRTGAGKSSLTSALFRMFEPFRGSIIIDGEDISQFGLHDVRKSLAIIPQDPVLFSGTIRSNLDPFNKFTDKDLWTVLERVHLKSYVKTMEKRLNAEITENGSNLSVGQRQLLCIGRALIQDTKILVMDEATASVDSETVVLDGLVQETVRTEFKDKTVITIAHRLHTIMDSDRILVLDKGEVKEFDTPANLIAANGIFHGLLKKTGVLSTSERQNMIATNEDSALI